MIPNIIPFLPFVAPPETAGIPQAIAIIPKGIPPIIKPITPQAIEIPASVFAPVDGPSLATEMIFSDGIVRIRGVSSKED